MAKSRRERGVLRDMKRGGAVYIRQNEVARLQDLLHGDLISSLTETGYAPLEGERGFTVVSDMGEVKLLAGDSESC